MNADALALKDGKEFPSDGIITEAVPHDPAEEFDAFATKTNADVKELKKLA